MDKNDPSSVNLITYCHYRVYVCVHTCVTVCLITIPECNSCLEWSHGGGGGGGVLQGEATAKLRWDADLFFFVLAAEDGDRQPGKGVVDHRYEWNYYQLSPPAAALHWAEFFFFKTVPRIWLFLRALYLTILVSMLGNQSLYLLFRSDLTPTLPPQRPSQDPKAPVFQEQTPSLHCVACFIHILSSLFLLLFCSHIVFTLNKGREFVSNALQREVICARECACSSKRVSMYACNCVCIQ